MTGTSFHVTLQGFVSICTHIKFRAVIPAKHEQGMISQQYCFLVSPDDVKIEFLGFLLNF